MKNVWLGLLLTIVIVLSYQNCYQPKKSDVPLTVQSVGIKLAEENIQKITFLNTENVTVEKNSKVFTLVSQITYSIDYNTGALIKKVATSPEQEEYCISETLFSELKNIINLSSVCKKELQPDSQRVCTEIYQPGYALVVTNRDEFDLGSSSDGCGSVQINLCASTSEDMLKGWFQAVRNQLPQLNCPE